MGHLPETGALPFYTSEATVRALRMDNHPVRAPILERLARLLERDELTARVAETYASEDLDRAHRDGLRGGYVEKLVVTP